MTLSVIRKLCCVVTGSIDYGVRTDLDGSPGSTTSRLGACLAGTDFSPVRELLPPHSTMAVVLSRQPQHTTSLAAVTGPGVAQPESFPEFFQVEPLGWGVGAYLHCNPELLRSFLTSPVGIYWKQVKNDASKLRERESRDGEELGELALLEFLRSPEPAAPPAFPVM